MPYDRDAILAVLDDCTRAFTFPMLDNGYVYLAASRLSLHRSEADWAMVIEVFGFSPRAGLPDTHVATFASRPHNRDTPKDYVNRAAYEDYLANNPHNESRFFHPISEGAWQDAEDSELVAETAAPVPVRGRDVPLPGAAEYRARGIELEKPPRVHVFEACRYMASVERDRVLATPEERRASVPPGTREILLLDEWHHPNVVEEKLPSDSPTFRQLAEVLATGDVAAYRPSPRPNTHWRHWPDGGRL